MCDDAENLVGAGTDVRRCSDALGPRKNLHRRVFMCVYLTGGHIVGVHLMGWASHGAGISWGVHLMGVYLTGILTLWVGIL
jgi:hypothetical protein